MRFVTPRTAHGSPSLGWAKWAPVNAAAIGAHLVGGGALLYANRDRAQHQGGVKANTITKIVVTGAALAATAYSGVLGAKIATADGEYVEGATEPAPSTPDEVTAAQRQLQYVQWALPALTGAIVVLGAQQGEQQRPRTNSHRARFHSGPSCPQVNPHCFPNRHD